MYRVNITKTHFKHFRNNEVLNFESKQAATSDSASLIFGKSDAALESRMDSLETERERK